MFLSVLPVMWRERKDTLLNPLCIRKSPLSKTICCHSRTKQKRKFLFKSWTSFLIFRKQNSCIKSTANLLIQIFYYIINLILKINLKMQHDRSLICHQRTELWLFKCRINIGIFVDCMEAIYNILCEGKKRTPNYESHANLRF